MRHILLLLMSGLGHIFATTSARMRVLICLSGVPVLAISAVLALHNYDELMVGSARRAATAITRLDLQFRHDTDRLRSALETIGGMGLTPEQIGHALRLAETMSGQRYCFLAILDSDGQLIQTVTPPGSNCNEIGTTAPRPSFQGTLLEAVQEDGNPDSKGTFLRITVPAIFLSIPETRGYLVGVLQLSRKAAYLTNSAGWQAFSDESNPLKAWLINQDGTLSSVCTDCHWVPPPASVVHQLQRKLEASEGSVVSIPTGEGGYALGAIAGGADILVATQRTPREADALHTMVLEISALMLLLVAGLIGVTLAANIVLVWPLRRLTYSVQKWQMEGVFDARITRSMPLELQRLGQAFTRATRRLTRHEARLNKAMAHQELLMREIHHRVKNNLQIVASLLNLQASRISHPDVRAEFVMARDRVRALATLHRTLYSEDRLDSLDMAAFLRELCEQTLHVAGEGETGRITLKIESDDFRMNPDQAVPLALIMTELVTNSIKYAFPACRKGTISVALRLVDDIVTLTIADDGIGCRFDEEVPEEQRGIGRKLIRGFARQLNAELFRSGENGTVYRFVFPLIRE
ncbi:sensor histidine kinase [Acetobacter farinalis]|uniref:histidine kinase n=1 Tax=Acetobacter farinalis TaxID=1260984 RepID=A0ABT3Q583_9PROT|nr:sensor histidine kinase [Acetobacter farinalis]MCX2560449.1 sensor histidine kinase [Acetobacter farinalis]